jgi:serine/threonine protein kinase
LSPEYATLGKLSEKVDVYSYGVLLLEIVSGRKSIDFSLEINKIYLLEWVSVSTFNFYKKIIIDNLIIM